MELEHALVDGSPPRAWGALCKELGVSLAARFTPTRVGSTGSPAPDRRKPVVHPHARGEHLKRIHEYPLGFRFTPTRVGSTIGGGSG